MQHFTLGLKTWQAKAKVHDFFAQIDTYAKVSNWWEDGKDLIANAKLQGIALQFVQGRDTLANDAYLTKIQWKDASPVSLY
jgi:hypothetical protein